MGYNTEEIVRGVIAAWNSHDVAQALTFYAADFIGHDVGDGRPQRGHEGVRRTIERFLRAFPDSQFNEDALVVQEQRAALFWTMSGTHRGKIMNIPATGRSVQVRGVSYFECCEGKITRIERIWDVAGMLRTIGLLPEL